MGGCRARRKTRTSARRWAMPPTSGKDSNHGRHARHGEMAGFSSSQRGAGTDARKRKLGFPSAVSRAGARLLE